MHRSGVILAAFLLTAPLWSVAATIEEPESVEEPDAPDASMPEPSVQEGELPEAEHPAHSKEQKSSVAPKQSEETAGEFNSVILRVLNKVTARTEEVSAPLGSVVRSGTIEIVAHSCWKSAPEDRPENASLLEISAIRQGEPPTRIFLGWMFSSSPGLSSLEDPFYDVTVVRCDNKPLKD